MCVIDRRHAGVDATHTDVSHNGSQSCVCQILHTLRSGIHLAHTNVTCKAVVFVRMQVAMPEEMAWAVLCL